MILFYWRCCFGFRFRANILLFVASLLVFGLHESLSPTIRTRINVWQVLRRWHPWGSKVDLMVFFLKLFFPHIFHKPPFTPSAIPELTLFYFLFILICTDEVSIPMVAWSVGLIHFSLKLVILFYFIFYYNYNKKQINWSEKQKKLKNALLTFIS